MDAYVVCTPSGAWFIGQSDGPNGSIIQLHHPQRYQELIDQKHPDHVRFAATSPLRAIDMLRLTLRFEAYASKDHMSPEAYQNLQKLVEDVIERRALQRSGLVKPGEAPSPEELAKIQEAIRNKISQGG